MDYCSEAVELAKQVATRELESSRIEFLVYMRCVQIVHIRAMDPVKNLECSCYSITKVVEYCKP